MSEKTATSHGVLDNVKKSINDEWNGYSLEELKKRRIIAYVHRELGREKLLSNVVLMKEGITNNGIKGLIFNNKELTTLKTADYFLMGWKAIKMFIKLRNRYKK